MSRLVYSTESGRLCPECQQKLTTCICKAAGKTGPLGDGNVKIRRETKGRKGKGVSIVSGLPLNSEELKTLAKELKQKLSSGGNINNGEIEFQGDQRDRLKALLEDKGYKVKLAGG